MNTQSHTYSTQDEITALATQLQEEKGAKESKEREMMAQLNEVQTNLGIANSQVRIVYFFCLPMGRPAMGNWLG